MMQSQLSKSSVFLSFSRGREADSHSLPGWGPSHSIVMDPLFPEITSQQLLSMDDLDWSVLLSDHPEPSEPSEDVPPSSLAGQNAAEHPTPQPDSTCARHRRLRAISARRRRTQRKNELDALRAEVDSLADHLRSLRSKRAVTAWNELAMGQLRKRQQAEAENAQLKLALASVRMNMLDLNALLAGGVLNTGVNMRDLLHSYAYLTRDSHARKRAYLAICSQQKLDLAFQIVTRETRNPLSLAPRIHVQPVPSRPDELAITTCAQFVLDTTDLGRAFLACCRAYFSCSVGWASFRPLHVTLHAQEIPMHDTRYSICDAQYASESTGEVVHFEERTLTYWKLNASCGVVVWDFVDVDELYPLQQSVDARRHKTASMVVRRVLCADGIERVACSTVCTSIIHFLPNGKPIVALDTVGSAAVIVSELESVSWRVQQTILENMRCLPDGISLY